MALSEIEKELSKRIADFQRQLREDGLATHCSTILVWGKGDTGENGVIPFFEGDTNFDQLTIARLDSIVAQVKVNGFQPEKTIILGDGEFKEFESQEQLLEHINGQAMVELKVSYEAMAKEKGQKFAREGVLNGITLTVSGHPDWSNLSVEEKMDTIAETIANLKQYPNGEWLPEDFTDNEYTKAIQTSDHIRKFGYVPKETGHDVAFA